MIAIDASKDRLTLDQKPGAVAWFLGVFIFVWIYIGIQILKDGDSAGYIFLAALVFPLLFLTLVTRRTLVFDRATQSLTITERSIYKKRQKVEELAAVRKAKVKWIGRGTNRMARLVIELDSRPVEFGTPQRKNRTMPLVKQINGWLDSKPPKA